MSEKIAAKFLEGFTGYDDCVPPGVTLPDIQINPKHYESLGISSDSSNYIFLKTLCINGLKEKGIDKLKNKKEYSDRIKYELNTLKDLGFIDYILLNWDILEFCHNSGIPTGPGRGSAAGSLVLYAINVTKVDPIKYELFFERFVSASRARKIKKNGQIFLDGGLLADIDNDIAYEHREKVIKYIEQKHPSRTAKILTLNTLSSKLCIRECGKIVSNLSEVDVNAITAHIPKSFGKVASIANAEQESEKFESWSLKNQKCIAIAKKIEGLNKNSGVHPSGIAICSQDMVNICPLQTTNDGALVTGYDMNWVAELMVKFDILGLRTLSVVHNCCNRLGIDPNTIPIDDSNSYNLFTQDLLPHGLFQIEAHTNFKVCKKIKPNNIEQLSAVVAIARPGALDFLDNYADYVSSGNFQSVHSFFDEELSYTGGIPLYQEQLMKMAVRIGFSLDEAEQLRRIVGKKKVSEMPKWKEKIQEKIHSQNLDEEIGDIFWKVAEDSANYSFNKSHSISYAILSLWTAYLKYNHPKEFFLSLLEMTKFEPSPQQEISSISKELPSFGIRLLPPNLIKSKMDFAVEENNIRYGLSSIKGISSKSLGALIEFRKEGFGTKFELFLAAKNVGLNIGVLSALIQAGALSDEPNQDRAKLVLEAQLFNILTDREKRNFIHLCSSQGLSVFDIIQKCKESNFEFTGDDLKPLIKASRYETLKKKYEPHKNIYYKNSKSQKFANWYFEKSLLGFSYSSNLSDVFSDNRNPPKNYLDFVDAQPRTTGKYIFSVTFSKKDRSRNGNLYIKLELEDEFGSLSGILCDTSRSKKCEQYLQNNKIPEEGSIIVLSGEKTADGDGLFINQMQVLDEIIYMNLRDLKQ
jgi:DNA-directed DNA polymerase III PolC